MLYRRASELRRSGQPVANMLPNWMRKFFQCRQVKILSMPNEEEVKIERPSFLFKHEREKSHVVDVGTLQKPVTQAPDTNLLVAAFNKGFNGKENLRMDFSFDGLGLKLPTGKVVLQGVSGEIRSGRMTACMGPSGAGKTTFMNVLMGKVPRTHGLLKINGVSAEMETFKKLIGYVPQEDIMLRELTVREIILYAAKTRLPSTWTSKDIEEHADNVIKVLNLSHVAHSPIGDELTRGVSGGQRKRVNIGMELAAVPLTIFLDEPTSGLDATSALDVAEVLKSISRLGLTIVSVIHQPRVEIFQKFDDVLMIAPGGRTAYLASVDKAKPYFESMGFHFDPSANVADILMDILAGRGVMKEGWKGEKPSPDDIVELWKSRGAAVTAGNIQTVTGVHDVAVSSINQGQPSLNVTADTQSIQAMLNISKAKGAGFLTQVWNAHQRSLVQQSRFLGALVLEIGVDGMLIGIAIALASAPSGVKVFGEEKSVFYREAASGLFSGVFCGFGPSLSDANNTFLIAIFDVGANRWAAEAQYDEWVSRYEGIYSTQNALDAFGYGKGFRNRNLIVMLFIGIAYRVIGFILMVCLNRDKQR
ncbi:hypothetical protein HDU76_006138 [Blyttiomyces sp. JEL0837]|nr:hypothetical protein HDU76_006138 [Blyttiomyces sp. JEL0837]